MQYWQMSGTTEGTSWALGIDLRQSSATMAVLHAETVRVVMGFAAGRSADESSAVVVSPGAVRHERSRVKSVLQNISSPVMRWRTSVDVHTENRQRMEAWRSARNRLMDVYPAARSWSSARWMDPRAVSSRVWCSRMFVTDLTCVVRPRLGLGLVRRMYLASCYEKSVPKYSLAHGASPLDSICTSVA